MSDEVSWSLAASLGRGRCGTAAIRAFSLPEELTLSGGEPPTRGPGAGARVALTWVPPMVVPSFGEETGLAARGLGGRRGGGLGGPEQAGHLRPSARA